MSYHQGTSFTRAAHYVRITCLAYLIDVVRVHKNGEQIVSVEITCWVFQPRCQHSRNKAAQHVIDQRLRTSDGESQGADSERSVIKKISSETKGMGQRITRHRLEAFSGQIIDHKNS